MQNDYPRLDIGPGVFFAIVIVCCTVIIVTTLASILN